MGISRRMLGQSVAPLVSHRRGRPLMAEAGHQAGQHQRPRDAWHAAHRQGTATVVGWVPTTDISSPRIRQRRSRERYTGQVDEQAPREPGPALGTLAQPQSSRAAAAPGPLAPRPPRRPRFADQPRATGEGKIRASCPFIESIRSGMPIYQKYQKRSPDSRYPSEVSRSDGGGHGTAGFSREWARGQPRVS